MLQFDIVDVIEKGGVVLLDVVPIDFSNPRDLLSAIAYRPYYEHQLGRQLIGKSASITVIMEPLKGAR